jgi:signal peptidase I
MKEISPPSISPLAGRGRPRPWLRILTNAAILLIGGWVSLLTGVFANALFSFHAGIAGLIAFGAFLAGWWSISRRKRLTNGSPPLSKLQKTAVVAVALILTIAFRTLLLQPFKINGASMEPNIGDGVYLLATKFSYGVSYHSFPFLPPLFTGRIPSTFKPERGDIVIFKSPNDNETDAVSRIIGLPGDQLQLIGGRLHLNGVVAPRELIGEERAADGAGRWREVSTYVETLPGGSTYSIIHSEGGRGLISDTELFVVPPNRYFVMGDNRDNSSDSRVAPQMGGTGFVPFENVVGRVWLVLDFGRVRKLGMLPAGITPVPVQAPVTTDKPPAAAGTSAATDNKNDSLTAALPDEVSPAPSDQEPPPETPLSTEEMKAACDKAVVPDDLREKIKFEETPPKLRKKKTAIRKQQYLNLLAIAVRRHTPGAVSLGVGDASVTFRVTVSGAIADLSATGSSAPHVAMACKIISSIRPPPPPGGEFVASQAFAFH